MQTQHGRSRDWSDPPNMGPNDPVPTATAQIPLRLQENLQLLDHMYPKTKVRTHACTYAHTYTCTYVRIHVHTFTHMYTHAHTRTHIRERTHIHTRTHAHTHAHTYTHIRIHIHTRTHKSFLLFFPVFLFAFHIVYYPIHLLFPFFHIQFLLSFLCPLLSPTSFALASPLLLLPFIFLSISFPSHHLLHSFHIIAISMN